MEIDDNYFTWNSIQSHILTGSGTLEKFCIPEKDFQFNDLAHHYLREGIYYDTFLRWRSEKRLSLLILGAWERPLFSGGWLESTSTDTAAFNLQSSSMFIDMRIPTSIPRYLCQRSCLQDCSDFELRILSRQHCFAGYTLPEKEDDRLSGEPVFTRHHIVDWNYHPSFPRSRPNRWWVVVQPPTIVDSAAVASSTNNDRRCTKKAESTLPPSFKEFSTTRDSHGVPIYFERWQRISPQDIDVDQSRRVVLWRPGCDSYRTAVLVVIGNHFAFCVDRDYSLSTRILHTFREDLQRRCKGGGPLFVDFLLQASDGEFEDAGKSSSGDSDSNGRPFVLDSKLRRRAVEEYLSLIGDYGQVAVDRSSSATKKWQIQKSTHPWREGGALFQAGDITWPSTQDKHNERMRQLSWRSMGTWQVFESSLDIHALESLFGIPRTMSLNRSSQILSKL